MHMCFFEFHGHFASNFMNTSFQWKRSPARAHGPILLWMLAIYQKSQNLHFHKNWFWCAHCKIWKLWSFSFPWNKLWNLDKNLRFWKKFGIWKFKLFWACNQKFSCEIFVCVCTYVRAYIIINLFSECWIGRSVSAPRRFKEENVEYQKGGRDATRKNFCKWRSLHSETAPWKKLITDIQNSYILFFQWKKLVLD